ncbi:MAG: hypothetical protein JW782_08225 [Candidatus Saganbacteria bacterium]|nr:hypothetical protein [Candidatus Saganbacteria bacterium]
MPPKVIDRTAAYSPRAIMERLTRRLSRRAQPALAEATGSPPAAQMREREIRGFEAELRERMSRSELLPGLAYRYANDQNRSLAFSYERIVAAEGISGSQYFDRLLFGFKEFGVRNFGFAERFLNLFELEPAHLDYLYYLGKLYQQPDRFRDETVKQAEAILNFSLDNASLLSILTIGRSFTRLMYAFDYLAGAERSVGEETRQIKKSIELMNEFFRDIFIRQKHIRTKLKETEKPFDLRDNEIRFLEALIELGEILEAVTQALLQEDSRKLASAVQRTIYMSDSLIELGIFPEQRPDLLTALRNSLIIESCRQESETALRLLIEAAADIKLLSLPGEAELPLPVDLVTLTGLLVRTDRLKRHEMAALLVDILLDLRQTRPGNQLERIVLKSKIALVEAAVKDLPETLPALMRETQPLASTNTWLLAWICRLLGIRTRNAARLALEPLARHLTARL